MNLLLVTGSRALDRTPAAAWWAQQQILGALARLEHGADIVTGDALGPDEWARRLAITAGLTALVFNLYGRAAVTCKRCQSALAREDRREACDECRDLCAPGTLTPVRVPWSSVALRWCPACIARGVTAGMIATRTTGGAP